MKNIALLVVSFLLLSCKSIAFKEKWTKMKAPEQFKAKFETTKGDFTILAERKWSPKGVDRLYQLIKTGFYTKVAFYRTVPNFVAQFGIQNDTLINNTWKKYKIPDEPVVLKNDFLTISFARSGKETRSTHLYINLKKNGKLDTIVSGGVKGYPGVAKIIKGGDVVKKLYNGYANNVFKDFDSIVAKTNVFLRKKYPKLDYIKNSYLID